MAAVSYPTTVLGIKVKKFGTFWLKMYFRHSGDYFPTPGYAYAVAYMFVVKQLRQGSLEGRERWWKPTQYGRRSRLPTSPPAE